MEQNIIENVDADSEPKGLNKNSLKQLIIYISTGFLILTLLFSIVSFTTRSNNKKKIILENKAKVEITEKNELSKDLLEENGYYYCINKEKKYNDIFRFYKASNKVIGACIGYSLSNLRFKKLFPFGNWFNEDYKANGRYEISSSGNKIAFEVGNVHYNGTLLEGQKMELFSHSDINGHENTRIFKFISLDVLKDIRNLDKNVN